MKIRALCLALVTVITLAGCSSSSTPPPAAVKSSTSNPAPDLRPQLLTVADLPAGWVLGPAPSGGGTTPPCIKNAKAKLHPSSRADQFFAQAGGIPVFAESLRYYDTNARAIADYNLGVARLNGCTDLSFSGGGFTFTGTIGPLPLTKLGRGRRVGGSSSPLTGSRWASTSWWCKQVRNWRF